MMNNVNEADKKIPSVLNVGKVFIDFSDTLPANLAKATPIRDQLPANIYPNLAHYVDLYNLAPVGYCTTSLDGKIIQANNFISNLLGVPCTELPQQSISTFFFDDDASTYFQLRKKLLDSGKLQSDELRVINTNGHTSWIKLTMTAEKKEPGLPVLQLTLIDISEHKKTEEKLRLASSVFTHTREGILVTDPEGNIVDVNAAFTRITHYTHDEVIGKNPRFLQSEHQNQAFYKSMWDSLLTKGYWHGEMWNRRKNGELYAEMKSINAVYDEHNNIINYVSLFKDITEKKLHQTNLEHIAHFDTLTNLPNRALLIDRLHQGLTQAQRRGEMLAVVFIDLDGFKSINDRFGHDAGDHLLIMLSNRMRQTLREGDTLSRLGGDEFIALLLDLPDIAASLPMLSRLLQAASQPVQFGEMSLQVSASLGVTFYPQVMLNDAEQLITQADKAMYYAKVAGKNRYHIFNLEQDGRMHSQHESLSRIENALNQHEFEQHYQPKVNMRTGEVIGVEALIRWRQPETGKLLLPEKFLPIVENHSLTISIDEWSLHAALTQIENWQAQGLMLSVSVNISPFHLQRANFIQRLSTILSEHPNVNPCYLELEVVETCAPEDLEHVLNVIKECRDLGITCALDNFGTGFSSITYLRRLPVTLLKIDLSFTHYMLENPDAILILEGAISLAHAFHLDVIAEGVYSVECGTMLMRLGCDLGQGSAIARPMTAEELTVWKKTWKADPEWADVTLASQEDFPLIFASVENKGWCKNVENYITGMSEKNPIQNKRQHQLGTWLNGVGLKRYGAHPAYVKIDDLYHRSYDLAKKMCDEKGIQNNVPERSQLNLLYEMSTELSQQVNTILLTNS